MAGFLNFRRLFSYRGKRCPGTASNRKPPAVVAGGSWWERQKGSLQEGLGLGGLVVVIVFLGLAHDDFGEHAGVLADLLLDLLGHVGIGLEEGLGVFAALADALAVI